jgi:YD repeat-containing protein
MKFLPISQRLLCLSILFSSLAVTAEAATITAPELKTPGSDSVLNDLNFNEASPYVWRDLESCNPLPTIKCEYDSEGRLIKKTVTDPNEPKEYKYEYDPNGRLIRKTYTAFDGKQVVEEYYYDSNGKLLKKITFFPGGGLQVELHEYDSEGKLRKRITLRPDGRRVVLEWDSEGKRWRSGPMTD